MSKVSSANIVHDATVTRSEGIYQSAVVGATQSAANAAAITHYRACLASAVANSCGVTTFMDALRQLGTGGQ